MITGIGLAFLVVIAVLEEATGFPDQHLDLEYQSQSNDEEYLDRQLPDCGTKRPCKIAGGRCHSSTEKCNGEFRTDAFYCKTAQGCGCCIPRNCVWNFKAYPNGAHIEDTCMLLKCRNGNWKYTGIIRHGCGECHVYGDPHFHPFDNHTWPDYPIGEFDYQGNGTFALTSYGLDPSSFGVNSDFVACGNSDPNGQWKGHILSCVSGASYYELGITVNLTINAVDICNASDNALCQIQVNVNSEEVNIGDGVDLFQGTGGTVAVFRSNHIGEDDAVNLFCMNVVGSKGLSLSLCAVKMDYAFLHVWAMPSLKNEAVSTLYGLCDTYTGTVRDSYTHRNGSRNPDPYDEDQEICDFGNSWSLSGEGECNPTKPYNPCDKNAKLEKRVEKKCNAVIPATDELKRASCLFDLCRVPDIGSYLEGYMNHAQVTAHFASNPCWCPPLCYGQSWCCPLCI